MITHEKARKLVSKIEYKSLLQNDLYDYITQQEKKDKLLEEELKYTKEQFDAYWKEVCILKPRLAKVEELLELYRNLEAWVEEYNTADSTLRKQGLLAEIRVARHLIAELEREGK